VSTSPAGLAPADRPPGALVAYRVLVNIFGVLVLVQAALAGQFLNGQGGLRQTHQLLAVAVFPVLSVLLVVLAALSLRRAGSGPLVLSAVLLVLAVAQTGLGFVGRSSLGAASIHIPLGVALFGLSIYALGYVKRLGR